MEVSVDVFVITRIDRESVSGEYKYLLAFNSQLRSIPR